MNMIYQILKEYITLEKNEQSLRELARKYNFTEENIKNDDNNYYYHLYYGKKNIENFLITIEIETRDIYRPFRDDDEPYRNTLKIFKNDKLIDSKTYIYFQ